jgi:small GTP-binding protein
MGDQEVKVVLIGSSSVGKTCIVQRATSGFCDGDTLPTLGTSYTSKSVQFGKNRCQLQIWDTAGQERYRGITPMYFRGAHAAIIVYAINDRDSFDEVDGWVDTFQASTQDATIFIVGNKVDLESERAVTEREGREKALEINAFFTEVSALTGVGIEELFQLIPEGCEVGPGSRAVVVPKVREAELQRQEPVRKKRKSVC